MTEKSEKAYQSVFNVALADFHDFKGTVLTDFEIALRNAVKNTMPLAELLGCFFHYAQVLSDFVKKKKKNRKNEKVETLT